MRLQRAGVTLAAAVTPDADLVAFITGDREHFVRTLGLQPWEDTPLVNRKGVCTTGHQIASEETEGSGCHDQHVAWALRQRLIAELETRGGFRWADLTADEETARRAWGALSAVAREQLGVPEETWAEIATRAGWKLQEATDGA